MKLLTNYENLSSNPFQQCWDPDPEPDSQDPQDPHVFGPPGYGTGSISQRCGSGSG